MRVVKAILVMFFVLMTPVAFVAQSSQSSPAVSVPRLISFSGVFRPADGQPHARVEEVTLAIYAEETGGTPLWQETQAVELDQRGGYSLLLGATAANGIPAEVFASGDAQWLGVVFGRPGEVEGPRVRITSVPYALRASDAATLGGRPASAYLLAPTEGDAGGNAASSAEGVSVITSENVQPGTQNFVAKYVSGSDVGQSGIYEFGGSVGIGTTAPFDRLHVRFNDSGGSITGYTVQNLSSSPGAYSGMLFYDQNGFLGQFQGFNNNTHEYRINNVATDGMGTPNGTINFMTGSVSRFAISTSGNIGIGTTSPAAAIDVIRSGGATAELFLTTHSGASANTGGRFLGSAARGTAAAPSAVQNGDILAFFSGGGYGATAFTSNKAAIAMRAAQNWTDAAQGTTMRFMTTPNGSTMTADVMTLDQTGFVGIGTTSPLDRLQVFGDIRVGTTGTNGCLKRFDGTFLVGTCASDLRFKSDVTPFGPTLGPLTALQPVHYYWRAAEFPDRHFGDSRSYGLIAQEVEQVLPELVVTGEDGFKAVDYTKLPLLTIQAVKELKAENDALKARVNELDVLRARVAELERLLNELISTRARP